MYIYDEYKKSNKNYKNVNEYIYNNCIQDIIDFFSYNEITVFLLPSISFC